ncbi:MAG: hypothetical protein K2N23_04180 [Clostridia bacterium]|nr:hypothetical protein [Clostridia bacterium]
MKKFLACALAFTAILFSTNFYSVNKDANANIDNKESDSCEFIDTSKLEELSNKYQANTEIEEDDTVPCAQAGSLEYTNFTDKEYYATTTFNRINYFENLSQYSAYNSVDSCGFVALIQALSFYDTFYNRYTIPYTYNRKNELATTENEAKAESPGVLRQVYDSTKYTSYYEYCNATQATDFQSYLTVLYNNKRGTNNDGQHKDDDGKYVDNFEKSIGTQNYQTVLNELYEDDYTVKVNDYNKLSQKQYLDLIKETISSGNPIVVQIVKYDSAGNASRHAVVAYDYDASNIYANFGWGRGYNRSPLLGGSAGYTEIYRAATLDFSKSGHWHSDNYVINSKSYCGCNISDKINFVVPEKWTNIPPTFYWMKDLKDPDETFSIEFLSFTFGDIYCSFTTDKNQMTLSANDWRNVLKSCSKDKGCLIKLQRISSKIDYIYSVYEIKRPSSAMEHITISPAEYGFYEGYNETEISSNIVQGKYTINTKRLRCGYIENECINLSARKEKAGTAYLDYSLDNYVYRIDVDLFLWSENEYLSSNDSTAYIQYKDSFGNWVTVLDLLNDIELSTDRLFPETYTVVFPEKTKEFRIYCSTWKIGDRNKGRLCIGDMSIYLEGK